MGRTREITFAIDARMSPMFKGTFGKIHTSLTAMERSIKSVTRAERQMGHGGYLKHGIKDLARTAVAYVGVAEAARFLFENTFETKEALGDLASLGVKDMRAIERAAMDASSHISGITTPEIIKSAYYIKSALTDLSDSAVGDFSKVIAITAKATKGTQEQMTDTFTRGYGIYKPLMKELSDAEWARTFSGGLAETVRSFKTTGAQMADAITALGASASAARIPLQEQLTVLGMLQTTMPGAEAGKRFRAFSISVINASKKLGIGVTDSNGRLKGMVEMLEAIRKKYPDLSKAEAAYTLKKAFGRVEAVELVKQLLPRLDEMKERIVDVHEAMGEGEEKAKSMVEAMEKGNPGAKWELWKQKAQNVAITLGDKLSPALNRAMDDTEAVVTYSVDHWGSLKWYVYGAVGAVTAYKVAVGTAMAISKIKAAIDTYGLLIDKITKARIAAEALNAAQGGGAATAGAAGRVLPWLAGAGAASMTVGIPIAAGIAGWKVQHDMHAAINAGRKGASDYQTKLFTIQEKFRKAGMDRAALSRYMTRYGFPENAAPGAGAYQRAYNDFIQAKKGKVPKHGNGGIFTSPHVGMIAEDGRAEVVLPLTKPRRTAQLLQKSGIMPGSSGSDGGMVIHYNPIINLPTGASGDIRSQVAQGLSIGQREFERMMAQYEAKKRRLAYG